MTSAAVTMRQQPAPVTIKQESQQNMNNTSDKRLNITQKKEHVKTGGSKEIVPQQGTTVVKSESQEISPINRHHNNNNNSNDEIGNVSTNSLVTNNDYVQTSTSEILHNNRGTSSVSTSSTTNQSPSIQTDEATNGPTLSTKISHYNDYSSSTLVKVPPEMENVVSFPPGCPVLFRWRRRDEEESSFRSSSSSSSSSSDTLGLGTVFSVSMDILSREFIHEIELNGRIIDISTGLTEKHIVSEKDLQYAPGCPVQIQNDDGSVIPNLTSNQQILEGSVLFGNFCNLPNDNTYGVNRGTEVKYSILVKLDNERYLAKHNIGGIHVKFDRLQDEGTLLPDVVPSSSSTNVSSPSESKVNNAASRSLVPNRDSDQNEPTDKSRATLIQPSVQISKNHANNSTSTITNFKSRDSNADSTTNPGVIDRQTGRPPSVPADIVIDLTEPTDQSVKGGERDSNIIKEEKASTTTSVANQQHSEEAKTVQKTNAAVEHRPGEVGTIQRTNVDSIQNNTRSAQQTTAKSINRDRRRIVEEVGPRGSDGNICEEQGNETKRMKISHSLEHARGSAPAKNSKGLVAPAKSSLKRNDYPCQGKINIPGWMDRRKITEYIVGPRGSTVRSIGRSTGCQISVLGKGSGADPKRFPGANDDVLHVQICSDVIRNVRSAQNKIEELLISFVRNDQCLGRLMFDLALSNYFMRKNPKISLRGAVYQRDYHSISGNTYVWMRVLELPVTDDGQYHGSFLKGKGGEAFRQIQNDFECTLDVFGIYRTSGIMCNPYVVVRGYNEDLTDRAIEFVQEIIAGHLNVCYCQLASNKFRKA